jgi:hypothetical protein
MKPGDPDKKPPTRQSGTAPNEAQSRQSAIQSCRNHATNFSEKAGAGGRAAAAEALDALQHHIRQACVKGRPDRILDFPQIESLLPLLPATDVYYALQEIGVHESTFLLALTSAEQFRTFLDLDIWKRDRVVPEKLESWLSALWAAHPEAFREKIAHLDPELLALYVARRCQVVDLTLEALPENVAHAPWRTPDTFFALLPLSGGSDEPEQHFRPVCEFVDRLYKIDMKQARRILMGARWETLAELEESSYGWRAGRLQDQGFSDYYEALEVYAYLKPAAVRLDEKRPDPEPDAQSEVAPALHSTTEKTLISQHADNPRDYLEHCLRTVAGEKEKRRLVHAAAAVANRLLAADLVESPDYATIERYLETTRRYLSLGLEFLTHGVVQDARTVFQNVTLLKVFRCGLSLTLDLRRLVEKLRQNGFLSLSPHGTTLLEHPWDDLVGALSARRPALPCSFDDPPDSATRPIATIADLKHGADLVQDLALQWPLCFEGLEFPVTLLTAEGLKDAVPDNPARVTLGDIFRTAFVHSLAQHGMTAQPLKRETLEKALENLKALKKQSISLTDGAVRAVEQALRARSKAVPPRLKRIIGPWLTPLEKRAPAELTVESLSPLVITASRAADEHRAF